MTSFEKGSLIMLCCIILLVIVFLVIMLLLTRKKNTSEAEKAPENEPKLKNGIPYEDIKKFLPFDDIKSNMIVQENGERFTMIVECEGINYYLMSEAERISVEEGFIQFLNSLRFPIQIYVQSRTINLDESINVYNKQVEKYEDEFNKMIDTFQSLDAQHAPDEKLAELGIEIERKDKILSYTKDLVDNISFLTQNSNVLQKKYYIVVSYHISELGLVNNFEPDEMFNLAYTELSNRAESICGGIYACGIEARILNTSELTEVIYIAVNRDDSDIFSIRKVVDSDIFALSTTSRDVMFKKQDLAKEERRARELQEERERIIREQVEKEMKNSSRLEYENDYNSRGGSTIL